MSKTAMSLSGDPAVKGVPTGFTLPVSDVYLSAGAGFIVVMVGEVSHIMSTNQGSREAMTLIQDRPRIIVVLDFSREMFGPHCCPHLLIFSCHHFLTSSRKHPLNYLMRIRNTTGIVLVYVFKCCKYCTPDLYCIVTFPIFDFNSEPPGYKLAATNVHHLMQIVCYLVKINLILFLELTLFISNFLHRNL